MARRNGRQRTLSAHERKLVMQLQGIVSHGQAAGRQAANARKARKVSNQRRDDAMRRNYRRGRVHGR